MRIEAAGWKILFTVHDEVVIECPEAEANACLTEVLDIMSTTPDWCAGLPVAAEGALHHYYTK